MPPAVQRIQWQRPHKQDRARQTADRLLEALEEILEEKSFREASVAEIVQRAQSSVGAFYGRFKDKDALLHALHARFEEEAIATAQEALEPSRWEGIPLADLLGAFAAFLVAHYRERRGLRRAIAEMQWIDVRFRERSAHVGARVSSLFAALLILRSDEIAHEDPRVAADMIHRIAFGVLDQHVQYGRLTPGAVAFDDDALQRELQRVTWSYLTTGAGGRRHGNANVAVADHAPQTSSRRARARKP